MATPVDLAAAEALIRARLVAIVEDTADVSDKVHDYWRNVQDEGTRNLLMKDGLSGSLHCWFVSLAFDGTLFQDRTNPPKGTLLYDVHAYMAINDANASEKVFAGKVLDVVTKLNGSQKLRLNGSELAGVDVRDSGPVQLAEFNSGTISNALVHHARITVPVDFAVGDC